MTYMSATIRLEDGTIYGIYAHYGAIIEVLKQRSIEPVREAIEEDRKAGYKEAAYELEEGEWRLNYYDCIVVDFKNRIVLDVGNTCFNPRSYLPDFEVHYIDLIGILESLVEIMFRR